MKITVIVSIVLLLLLVGCSQKSNIPTQANQNSKGNILLKIDRENKPANVVEVDAYLTREGYDTLSASLNLISDTTADVTINDIAAGDWHLTVNALDESSTAVYTGETDVTILAEVTTQVYLTLTPTGNGFGNIYIHVGWGTPQNTAWTDYQNNPIVTNFNTIYDIHGVGECFVLKDDNNYKMWYVGLSESGVGYGFYAYSSDGLSWTRYSNTPILFPGPPGNWDSWRATPGPVIKEDGVYKMYYQGWADNEGVWDIGLATSSDGVNWTKYAGNPILTGGDWDFHLCPQSIVKKDNIYYLFYTGRSDFYGGYIFQIGVATSADGITWQKYSGNPVMTNTEPWEGTGVAYPSVIYENDQFTMVYEGVKQTNTAIGFAYSSDGFAWTKNENNPFFGTEDCNNDWVKILYPSFIKDNNESRVYYTGVDPYNNDLEICLTRKIN